MQTDRGSIFGLLLAGGSGTRMWPVSRQLYPKQFVSFLGAESLVQTSIKRLAPLIDMQNVRVVCGRQHLAETARHLQQIGLDPEGAIISEPCGRNTAPAILLAALKLRSAERDPVLCVFPADHVIRDTQTLHRRIADALRLAQAGYIVTFGIQPAYPETGYGYIEAGAAVGGNGFKVKRFVEKPALAVAKSYLQRGNFFWNSGMFCFKRSVILQAFAELQPQLYERMRTLVAAGDPVSPSAYEQLPDISIDYAIMEKTDNCVVLPSDFGWSDIGSWKSLYDYLPKDDLGNVVGGDVILNQTKDCFILAHDRLIAANYLHDLVVVETPDSVFVSDLENSREVKSIVQQLKGQGRREYQQHTTVYHGWGSSTDLARQAGFCIRRLEIYPAGDTRLTAGGQQTVHLCVLDGEVKACGQEEILMQKGALRMLSPGQGLLLKNVSKKNASLLQTVINTG